MIEENFIYRLIGLGQRLKNTAPAAHHVEHPASGRQQIPLHALGARVEHLDVRVLPRDRDTRYFFIRLLIIRVAFGGDDHADTVLFLPFQGDLGQALFDGGQ